MIPFFFHLIYHFTVYSSIKLPALMWKVTLNTAELYKKKS